MKVSSGRWIFGKIFTVITTEVKMGIEAIIGALISGFACRVYAAGMAVFVANEAMKPLSYAMNAVQTVLP